MQSLLPHLQSYSHVIWDWNGTLLSDLSHAVTTVNHLLKKRNLPLLSEETYKKHFHFPIRSYYERIGFDLANESFEELCDEFVDLFMRDIFQCKLVPGAQELLKTVKSLGKRQSILSASDQQSLDRMITHYELRPHLDSVFGIADKFAASKVYRGHELIELSGIDKKQTVLVGDTDHDLEVAHSLGIEAILVAHGHQESEKLRRLHHRVIDVDFP
jgi:phosphoglycolate phosphatase